MSNISSSTLFHFTNYENLKGILSNKFYPKYSIEPIPLGNIPFAVPMVSFCDIPLSQISEHVGIYGEYGIGMTKEWGKNNGLNPVLYLTGCSGLLFSFLELFEEIKKAKNQTGNGNSLLTFDLSNTLNKGESSALKIVTHAKPYESKRGKINCEKYSFYNEREWRYVPKLPINELFLNCNDYYNLDLLAQANESIKSKKLCFETTDIKYIIVKNENEISEMIKHLKSIKEYEKSIEILNSRIITYEQIKCDF